jgi:hypothetical protein
MEHIHDLIGRVDDATVDLLQRVPRTNPGAGARRVRGDFRSNHLVGVRYPEHAVVLFRPLRLLVDVGGAQAKERDDKGELSEPLEQGPGLRGAGE